LINEVILTLFVLFHHTNIAFRGETWLSRILIVPKLHRLHHSARRDEHDSTYGCVFSVWDRAFGTIKEAVPADIGLMSVNEQSFIELLKFGFMMTGPGFRPSNSRPAGDVERVRRHGACDSREWASAGKSQARDARLVAEAGECLNAGWKRVSERQVEHRSKKEG
jgi:hypothetical protein